MSSLLRLSIVYATFVIPVRYCRSTSRVLQCFVVYAICYFAMIRTGFLDVVL